MADTHPPKEPIRTPRLILREAREYDLPAMHKLYSNKEVMQYWSRPFTSLNTTRSYVKDMVHSPTNGESAFVIVLPPPSATTAAAAAATFSPLTAMDEGTVIGHAGIWHADCEELVFMIDRAYWGQGYMTEVLAALMPVFWQRGLRMVYADVEPDNEASVSVLRRCGFVDLEEGMVEVLGKAVSVRMEIANPDGRRRGGEEEEEEGEDGEDD